MVTEEVIDKNSNIRMLSFSTIQMPEFKMDYTKEYVKYGKDNLFPNELLRLVEEHEEHGAIVNAKANYLLGGGFCAEDEIQDQFVESFFKKANRYESWTEINDKVKLDCEIFNGFYLQVITDLTGKPLEWFHLQYANCRLSPCKKHLWYSSDWTNRQCEPKSYGVYEPGKVGTYFVHFSYYKPTKRKLDATYSTPQYMACVKSIATDIDISTFNNNYVANGFSAGTIISFYQDEPKTEDKKRKLKESIINTYSSPEKAGSIVLAWVGKDGQAPKIESINVDDLDKKFEITSKRCLDKIIRGHNVTNPELFGVKTEGQLGTRVSLKESYELMLNTYTKPRQKKLCKFYEKIIYWTTGQIVNLEIEQLEPIGLDLYNDPDLTVDERRILKGYDPLSQQANTSATKVNDAINALSPLVANKVLEKMTDDEVRALASLAPLSQPKLDANGQPIQAAEVNDNLKGLSAAENADMQRIVRDFQKGRNGMTEHMALTRLQSYGLTEDQARKWLGLQPAPVNMSSQKSDFIIALFEQIDTTVNAEFEYELLLEEDVHFHNSRQALNYESTVQLNFKKFVPSKSKAGLADFLKGLIGIKKDPGTTVNDNGNGTVTEIITKYQYAVRPDAPPLSPGGKSRDFCQKMMAMAEAGKEFTFEQIDGVRVAGLSNGMPEVDNIWDYRGGFYNNPETKQTEPFCRHYWKAKTYKVTKKI